MPGIADLLATYPYIDLPHQPAGWAGFILMLVVLLFGLVKASKNFWLEGSKNWGLFTILVLAAPLASLILGVNLPGNRSLPVPYVPGETGAPMVMVVSALPWVLAGGLLGPLPAVVLALLDGTMLALWGTHSLFTPLELGGFALIYSLAVRQNYRTPFYTVLRHPLGAGLVLGLAYLPVFLLSAFFATNGPLAVRFDYALTQHWPIVFTRLAEIGAACLVAEILMLARPSLRPQARALRPSPSETSLQTRFLMGPIPWLVLFLMALMLGDWVMAGNAARQMLEGRMSSTATVAADSLPFFLESGQNLILSMASPDLAALPQEELDQRLEWELRSVAFFRELFFLNAAGEPVTGYPVSDLEQLRLSPEEEAGINLALGGVMVQTYTLSPWPGEDNAQVSFIASVRGGDGSAQGVLIGRTDLRTNPFTRPALEALDSVQADGGEAFILDENRRVLYHTVPDSTLVMSEYFGELPAEAGTFDEVSPTGTRQMVIYQPVAGRSWSVVLTMPAVRAQELSLSIAVPLLGILAVFSAVAIVLLSLGLRSLTLHLHTLAYQATLIAQGKLDSPLAVRGEDEAGRLARAFEMMRLSLKGRLEELNRLLKVSQGVAANLEISQSVRPILEAALIDDAIMARVVLIPEVRMELLETRPVAFGYGPASEMLSYLDQPIYELMRHESQLLIPNTARARRLTLPPDRPQPASLIALSLQYENAYYGTLWVAYSSPRSFKEEQVRYLSMLASEAAVAAANARLYASAEIGRQRLEAVLASTPEPVLVFDERNRLLLLNPAAAQVPGLMGSVAPGQSLAVALRSDELKAMIASPNQEPVSREINLSSGRVFYTSVSRVIADGHRVGTVCILRDITHFKNLDTLKSEFVATVSHDLRSPLSLIRGHANMLRNVGELNEQQKIFLKNILDGIDNMTALVNTLLDLGRIEAGVGLKIEELSAQSVIEQVMQSLRLEAAQKNITLELMPGSVNGKIEADQALLRQALYNLLDNAIRYTPQKGKVRIGVQRSEDSVIFEVHDTGIGIAPLDLPRVFEKFYRCGHREAQQQRGTGLGLAIVKSIAERHNGQVWAESQLGKGSSFYLEIPLEPVKKVVA